MKNNYGKPIYEGANFEIKYLNNIEVGTATIEISGINNFKGTITKTFVIEKQPENSPSLSTVKDNIANLKLPFAGVEDNSYTSTPYFRIQILAILIILTIYILVRKKIIEKE